MMTFGSLFSGIGGIDLGLERAGMECKWQVEIDEYCQKVLSKHWPDVPKFGDIHDCNEINLTTVDLIAGGFPCQPISRAGKRLGSADERWLWPEFARIIRLLRPRYVLVENVSRLLTSGLFNGILGDLAESGYDAEWDCLPAAAFGAPHLRDRIFLVAYSDLDGFRQQSGWLNGESWQDQAIFTNDGAQELVANPTTNNGKSQMQCAARVFQGRSQSGRGGGVERTDWWVSEPEVGRVAYGIPARLVRQPLERYGNAVVPQITEWIGRRIIDSLTGREFK